MSGFLIAFENHLQDVKDVWGLIILCKMETVRIHFLVMYSGDLNNNHLVDGKIWIADFQKFGIQIIHFQMPGKSYLRARK